MAEYIERGELEAVLHSYYNKLHGMRPDFYAGFAEAFKVIEEETSNADVVPVKHGGWKKIGYKWVCSNCRSRLTLHGTPTDNNIFYCPACGAKMDGGADT